MTVRKKRKKNKLRGQRTHGKGDTKNKRGAGVKGGRGRAGSHKHKYSKYYMVFGTEKKKVKGRKLTALNLDDIQRLVPRWEREKKIEKKENLFVLDGKNLGVEKILSRGNIDFPVIVRNMKISKKAAEKIEKANGIIETTETTAEEMEEFEQEGKQ